MREVGFGLRNSSMSEFDRSDARCVWRAVDDSHYRSTSEIAVRAGLSRPKAQRMLSRMAFLLEWRLRQDSYHNRRYQWRRRHTPNPVSLEEKLLFEALMQ